MCGHTFLFEWVWPRELWYVTIPHLKGLETTTVSVASTFETWEVTYRCRNTVPWSTRYVWLWVCVSLCDSVCLADSDRLSRSVSVSLSLYFYGSLWVWLLVFLSVSLCLSVSGSFSFCLCLSVFVCLLVCLCVRVGHYSARYQLSYYYSIF